MRKLLILFLFTGAVFDFWHMRRAWGQQQERTTIQKTLQMADASPLSAVASVGTQRREDDLPALAASPDGSLWLVWQSYADRRDEIGIRQYRDGTWGNLQWVPNTSGDVWLPQIAVDQRNRPWIVWSQQQDGNWDLYARYYDPEDELWGPMVRLTDHPMPDINPRLASNTKGEFALVWQGFRHKDSNIYLKTFHSGEWSETVQITGRPANEWEPAVALDSGGTAWVTYDSYENGNYDVYLAGAKGGEVTVPEMAVAESPLFEARPTVVVDKQDRVWVAWESGGANWGKDTGYNLRPGEVGVGLGGEREVKIRCYVGGRWQAPATPLRAAFHQSESRRTHEPYIFVDSNGTLWVAAKRQMRVSQDASSPVRTASDNKTSPLALGTQWTSPYGEYWLTHYNSNGWSAARPIPESWGRMSTRIAAVSAVDGGVWLAWPTDNRRAEFARRAIRHEVFAGRMSPAPPPRPPSLITPEVERVEVKAGHTNEAADLDAIRSYRTSVSGRSVQIVRGDLHRHTDLSGDGGHDGSLQDFYRYMIDAASMDFGASTDHQGGSHDYWWWYSQKMTDMYHIPGAYVSLFGFERSVPYPGGHHNVLYSNRSGRVIPYFMRGGVSQYRLGASPQGDEPGVTPRPVRNEEGEIISNGVVANDTLLLYEEVRRMGGLAIPHTSGTDQGNDWRYNNPEFVPVVEIFQGARTSYEYPGAPLSAKSPADSPSGYQPDGFVRNAWDKGRRLGIIASSDHFSTHYAYAMVYTDRSTREGILDAIRRRHTYGATDNILLDVRMGGYFMGDEFRVDGPLRIKVKVRGTRALEKVHIIRGGKILYTRQPDTQEVTFEYTDTSAPSGTQYYYVRVEQVDKQLAWSSPCWVNH